MLPRNERTFVQIAQRLQTLIASPTISGRRTTVSKTRLVERFRRATSRPAQDSARIRSRTPWAAYNPPGQNDQADKGRHAPARQHPVVDLQHEDRAGQIKQVDHATHDADADESAAAGTQRVTEFGNAGHRGRLPSILISSRGVRDP